MFETRLEVAIWAGIAAIGLGVLASMNATEETQGPVVLHPKPPEAPIDLNWDLAVLAKPEPVEAGAPPPSIPCNAGEPGPTSADPNFEAALKEDPYAG